VLLSKKTYLLDLAEYQKDSIVSKIILDKNNGSITFFAFDEKQGLSEHTAPFDAMVYVVDGEVDITISRKSSRLKVGDMIILPANKPHALKAIKKFKMILIMIK
jgi:quercetin dioxygenase-like cupin family protein